ncbi:hypothetical protein, conserved [Eimeria praecox]|uniref:Uncharacterized protein n=1 Tax=Eimeria praecox TaxID=51316 RepID=U6G8Q7_9EIME|nr:hypothetical protein, conserved [Eimeria praecox]
MSKASLAASEGKDSDGIERQQISSLEDSVAEINRNAKEHSEKFHWAPREERSSQGKQRNDPEGMDKTVEEAECPKNDGSLKQHSTRVQKQKKSDDAKQCSMVDKPKSLAAPVAEAIEKKKKSEKQRHNSNAAKNVISRHTMETPRQDVSEGSCKLQRGNAASNQTNGNNLELKKDGLALPCTGETKLPKAAKAADPMPTSHKITIESQGIQSEPVAGTGPAEQRLTSGCQNRESHFCEDKQLADQTTLFGIECRVRPESAHSAKWISFA